MKNYYDLCADDITFEEGDAVWLHNPCKKVGHSPKLMRPWEGPYTIIKVINDVVYRIQLTPRGKALCSFSTPYATRSHDLTLTIPHTRTDSFQYSFFCHTPNLWNQLPHVVVSSVSLNTFKKAVKDHLVTHIS